jgi:uncharacterized protein YodC (DUF2158 family)
MTRREGPTLIESSYQSCCGCKWWDHYMVRSGLDPIYENQCLHPDVKPEFAANLQVLGMAGWSQGRFIGRSDYTPDWCPVIPGDIVT